MLRQVQIVHRLAFSAAAVALATSSALGGRVVIVEGFDARPGVNDGIHAIATIAQINYLAKGYTVERLSNAMGPVGKAAVLQALNDPRNNALFFCGHGDWTPPGGPFVPGLVLGGPGAGGVLTPADIPAADAARMLHVEFQSCGQKLPAWDAEFPNAGGIDAWTRSVTVGQARNDARNGSPARIPAKDPPARPGTDAGEPKGVDRGAPSVKTTDPRIVGAILATPSHMMNPAVDEMFDEWTQIGFTLPPPVAVTFGARTFNVRTMGPGGTEILKGLSVSGGMIVGENTGFPAPDFTLEVDAFAFTDIMANIDTLPSFQSAGDVRIVGNTTGLPDNVLIAGAAGAYFGMFSLRPPCPADLNLDWAGNTADLVVFLGNFGSPAFPFTGGDINGSGVVDTADLVLFLAAFGCG